MTIRKLLTTSAALLLACTGGQALAQINDSLHDLGTGGLGQGAPAGTNIGVCVFCHTPHGSDTSAPVPLWNKVLPTGTSYTMYSTLSTPSLDGTQLPMATSPSLACLSCHDGGQAMDVVLNAPGSGNYVAPPVGQQIDATAVGSMTGTPVPNLGTDLTDDHPISIQYAGGGCSDSDLSCAAGLGDTDFVTPQNTTLNGNQIWWVDSPGGSAGTREKTDMLLYTRNNGGTLEPFVECGSCHDPHNAASAAVDVSPAFMRIANTDSQVCLTCHNK